MRQRTLLLDLGSSTIKARLVDNRRDSEAILNLSTPMPGPTSNRRRSRHETDPQDIVESVRSLLMRALQGQEVATYRLAVSSQMHSALITDGDGSPVTPMISWQDDRLTEPDEHHGTRLAAITGRVPDLPRRRAGVALRPGYGAANLAVALAELGPRDRSGASRIHTLGSFVTSALGGPHVTHVSSAAALGLVNLDTGTWDPELVSSYGLSGLALPEVVAGFTPVGLVTVNGQSLHLFPDVGDHQSSVLGGGCLGPGELAISLGTAGIAARWSPHRIDSDEVDSRPYPGGGYLLAVSRLPGGRVADDFTRFVTGIAHGASGVRVSSAEIWDAAQSQVKEADPESSLRIEEHSLLDGGTALAILGAVPGDTVLGEMLYALLDHYVGHFRRAVRLLFPDGPLPKRVHFNGGLAMRSPWLREQFARHLGLDIVDTPDRDLALDGLRVLLQQHQNPRKEIRDATI